MSNYKKIFLFALGILFLCKVNAQTNCCDDVACKQRAKELADKITGLAVSLGKFTPFGSPGYPQKNDSILLEFKTQFPDRYNEFTKAIKDISAEFIDDQGGQNKQLCFLDQLPINTADNTMAWVNYIRDVKPVFPSTEFCKGFKKRFELSQGASAFLSKQSMAYLGALRFYLIYTFSEKDKCGGRFRLMTGPGFFLRDAKAHLTLSSRLGVRIGDLKGGVFSIGNFNFFGGFNSNFNQFNYAESGFEAELGWLGLNLSAVYDTYGHKWGFLAGIVLANTKFKSK
jgi:hypothetical protein